MLGGRSWFVPGSCVHQEGGTRPDDRGARLGSVGRFERKWCLEGELSSPRVRYRTLNQASVSKTVDSQSFSCSSTEECRVHYDAWAVLEAAFGAGACARGGAPDDRGARLGSVGRFERNWCLEGVGTLPKGEISTRTLNQASVSKTVDSHSFICSIRKSRERPCRPFLKRCGVPLSCEAPNRHH